MVTEEDLIARLRLMAEQESQQAVCARFHLDPGVLSNVFSGKRRLPQAVAEALGYRRVERYEPIGRGA